MPATAAAVTDNLQAMHKNKVQYIESLLAEDPVDLWKLREACWSEGGLVHDALRKRAWPLLVGLASADSTTNTTTTAVSGKSSSPTISRLEEEEEEEEDHGSVVQADAIAAGENSLAGASRTPVADTAFAADGTTDADPSLVGPQQVHHQQHHHVALGDDTRSTADDSATTMSRHNIHTSAAMLPPSSPRLQYPKCQDHYQIDLDVARCTWHLLTGDQRAQRYQMEHKAHRQVARIIRRKQRRLGHFINLTLVQEQQTPSPNNSSENNHPDLRYYQGYHDVACIFLTTLASGGSTNSTCASTSSPSNVMSTDTAVPPPALELPAQVLRQVSEWHLRDYLKDNFVDLQTAVRLTLFPLLAMWDPAVHHHLQIAELEPFFCLSWIITWFAHDVRDSHLVKRLFDVFVVSHPLLPLYVSVAMVTHPINRQLVLETEADFALLHQMLRGLPRNSSMVGWKYRPGDGYVSDDEDDEDDDDDVAAAVEARLDAAVEGDLRQLKFVLDNKDGLPRGATSSVSTGTQTATDHSTDARVPFEELLSLALQYMNKVPPRQLLSVARRYYGKAHVRALLAESQSISLLLGDLPSWAIQSTLPIAPKSPLPNAQELRSGKRGSKAVTALGLGISDWDRRRRRRRRYFWFGVVTVAILAVAISWYYDEGTQWQRQFVSPRETPDSGGANTTTCGVSEPSLTGETTCSPPGAEQRDFSAQEATITADGKVYTVPPHGSAKGRQGGASPFNKESPFRPKGERPNWLKMPFVKWFQRFRMRGLMFKKSTPLLSDGKPRPARRRRIVKRLKPLRDFLSTPWEQIVREAKKIAWDQGILLQRWLNHPTCFSNTCSSSDWRQTLV